jgi:hypothetical protein
LVEGVSVGPGGGAQHGVIEAGVVSPSGGSRGCG